MAEATLASLSVEIKASGDKFSAELAKVDARLGNFEKSVSARIAKIDKTFSSLSGTVSAVQSAFAALASAAALGGLTSLVKGALEAGDNIADLSKQLNLSSDALQQMQFAFSQTGSSAEAFNAGFVNLTKNVGDAAAGIGRAKAVFEGLRIDVKQFAKDLAADPTKALAQFADRIKAIPNAAQQAATSLRLVGDPTWVGVLKEGGAALLDTAGKAKILSKEAVAAADDLNDKINAVSSAIKTEFNEALIAAGPLLLKFIGYVAQAATGLVNLANALRDVFSVNAAEQISLNAQRIGDLNAMIGRTRDQLASVKAGGGLLDFLKSDAAKEKELADLEKNLKSFTDERNRLLATNEDLTASFTESTNAIAKTTPAVNAAEGAFLKFGKATKDTADKTKEFNDNLAAKIEIYKQVTAGIITLDEAEKKLAALQLAGQGATSKQAQAFADAKEAAEDYAATIKLIAKLSAEKIKIDAEDEKANKESLRSLQEETISLQEEARLLEASLGPKERQLAIEKEIALARIDRQRETELTTAKENELTEAEEKQIDVNANLRKSIAEATAAEKEHQEALKNSLLTTGDVSNAFKQLATGFFQGTRDLKGLVGDFGKGLAVTMFGKFIEQKFFSLDKPLIDNVSGLMGQGGFLSSIFSAGGNFFGNLFGSSTAAAAGEAWQTGWNGIFNGTGAGSLLQSGASTGAAFGLSFGQAAGLAAALPLFLELRKPLVKFVAGLFGGGSGAKIGANFGFAGAFIGSLFDHIPTAGTRVRKGVVDFLKDIKATFAEEINTKHYFFKETKDLAASTFGGDFLAASKQILKDKVGPELGNQLKALGAFITADQAKKLGKSVEQTGTTFGNLLAANLGIDALPDAISEIVDKSGLTLDILVKKLNDLFLAKDIGWDFFKDTILGAVDIFAGDLPEAIGVSKIALKSFAEDRTFDLEKFKKSVEGATDVFNLVSQQFVDAIKNSKSGEEAARIFGEGLKKGLKDLALDAFLKDFIDKRLFAGIDLSDGLDSGEIEILKGRIHDARIEAAAFITALDDTGDAVDGVTEKVRELNATLADLENKRIQIQVDFASQLGSIGALTPQQVIDVRKQSIAPTVNKALNPAGPIGTHPFSGFTDTELQDANDALKEAGDLAVASFHAFEQEQKDLLQTQIETINNETQTAIDGIHKEFDAKRDAGQRVIDGLQKQKELQSRIFQDRIDALQTELQTAQEFRRVSESIQQTINSLTLSNSPLFGSEKLAFLQRQATGLRGDSSAKAIEELSQNLASQLQVGQEFLDPTTFAKLFGDVTDELQRLRDKTAQQGNRAEDIQRNIEKLQEQSTAALDRIDAQITAQQTYIQSLATSESNAIAAAQRAGDERISAAQAVTTKAINEYRDATVAQLKEFAAARDEIVAEQKFREIQRAKLDDEQLTHIKNIDANTFATADLIRAFLASNATQPVTPAATGFSGIVDRPRLFLAGESGRESVSIQPVGKGSGSVTFAPTISVTMQGSSNPEQDGARLGKALSDALLREYQTGPLGRAIRDDARRRG